MMVRKKADAVPVSDWKNRIVGHGEVPARGLVPNPENWRRHPEPQRRALAGALSEVGWVQDVIVNQRTGRIVDGHMRAELAAAKEATVPVVYVDLSEDEERLVLASLDPLAAIAITDDEELEKVLSGIKTDNADLTLMFGNMIEHGIHFENGEAKDKPGSPEGARTIGDRQNVIKAAIYAPDVAILEQALRLTGETNRGAALMAVCRSYIENEKGQFDFRAEGAVA
ncbi:MAG: hypothetical protein A2Z18_11140 [Armatimonadetes bacterium RBG_16_58_9]|nr:MAG: hypothetical protein A2Z18_11140 [Armatimonadetes bacterium RBG_16_58_9]